MTGNTTTDGTGVPVTGTTSSGSLDFVVVGWSANLGSDWNAVFAGRPLTLGVKGTWTNGVIDYVSYGISVVAQDIPMAPSTGPFNPIFGPAGVPNLTLYTIWTPEPSPLAVAGVGAVVLRVFGRRNRRQADRNSA
jgi:hypothetical protein